MKKNPRLKVLRLQVAGGEDVVSAWWEDDKEDFFLRFRGDDTDKLNIIPPKFNRQGIYMETTTYPTKRLHSESNNYKVAAWVEVKTNKGIVAFAIRSPVFRKLLAQCNERMLTSEERFHLHKIWGLLTPEQKVMYQKDTERREVNRTFWATIRFMRRSNHIMFRPRG